MNEVELGQRARQGDATALATLLRDAYALVHSYLVRATFHRALADDLTQATMERAIRRLDTWDGRAKFSTWLVGIASHLYLDELRRQTRAQRHEPPVDAEDLVAQAPDPEAKEALRRLATLPREVALAIVLKHAHGYTYEEIAALTGWPTGTVKSRISNALAALREEASHE